MAGARAVFVYNDADRSDIIENSLVDDVSVIHRVAGSGVDVDHYAFAPAPFEKPVFLMVARLIKDKGVFEYVEAARRLKQQRPNAEFQLLGPFDPNPGAISRLQVQEWIEEGIVDYLGETNDVRPFLANCNIFVLPSYYREGIPAASWKRWQSGARLLQRTCRVAGTPSNPGRTVTLSCREAQTACLAPCGRLPTGFGWLLRWVGVRANWPAPGSMSTQSTKYLSIEWLSQIMTMRAERLQEPVGGGLTRSTSSSMQ